MAGAQPSTVGNALMDANEEVEGIYSAENEREIYVELVENPSGQKIIDLISCAAIHEYTVSYGRLETEYPELVLIPADRPAKEE